MRTRSFPFSPHSATELEAGDLIPVQALTGEWACLQVVELRPRARTSFVVGALSWRGHEQPTPEVVQRLAPFERALARIEIFTEGGLQVIGNVAQHEIGQERWLGPSYIGKSQLVQGWKATIRLAQKYAASAP